MEIDNIERLTEQKFENFEHFPLDVGICLLPTEQYANVLKELNNMMHPASVIQPNSKITFRSRLGIELRLIEAIVPETEVILIR